MKMPTSIMETAFKDILEESTKISQKVNVIPKIAAVQSTPSMPSSLEQTASSAIKPKHLLIAAGIGLTIWIVYEMIQKRHAEKRERSRRLRFNLTTGHHTESELFGVTV